MSGAPARSRYDTTDPEAAHEFMRQAYLDLDVETSIADPDTFTLRSVTAQVPDLTVSRVHYAGELRIRTLPVDRLIFAHLYSGRYVVSDSRATHRMTPGRAFLFPPDRAQVPHFDDIDLTVLIVPRALIEEAAGEMIGRLRQPVTFGTPNALSPELGAHWLRTADYVQRTLLAGPDVAGNPLITGPARRALAAAALAAFPNSTLRAELDGSRAEPVVLRRVLDHVEANAHRDLALGELVTVAGCSTRALQYLFAQHRETTPTAHVRRVRLDRAHHDLQAADPTTATVAGIARRWGFSHAGRFSADYRAAYGQPPGATLRG